MGRRESWRSAAAIFLGKRVHHISRAKGTNFCFYYSLFYCCFKVLFDQFATIKAGKRPSIPR